MESNKNKGQFPNDELVNNMNFAVSVCKIMRVDHTKAMKFQRVYSIIRYQMDKSIELVGVHRINKN